jgi:hypothetical protein
MKEFMKGEDVADGKDGLEPALCVLGEFVMDRLVTEDIGVNKLDCARLLGSFFVTCLGS